MALGGLFIFELIKNLNKNFYLFLSERLSLNLFFSQLSGDSSDGHVGNMYKKWLTKFLDNQNILDILFSFDPTWKFPDSLVLFFVANNGVIGIILSILLISILFSLMRKSQNYLALFALIFSIIVSFKGFYPFNNIGMFIFLILMKYNSSTNLYIKT